MTQKIILAVIGVLIIGVGFFAWRQNINNDASKPMPILADDTHQSIPTRITDVELSVGGNFQTTKYTFNDSELTYFHSGVDGEQNSTAALTSADRASLDSIFAKYNLDTLHSDPTPGPDMGNYYLVITKGNKTYKLQFVSSQNLGFTLSSELENVFNKMKK